MSVELPDQSEALKGRAAIESLEERARRKGEDAAWVRMQIESHEKRLDAQNGNIRRMAEAQEKTNDVLEDFRKSVDQSTAVAKARADTAAELAERAARGAVDKKTIVITAIGCSAAMASAVIAALALILG